MTAGLVTLELISKPDFFKTLTEKTETLVTSIQAEADKAGIPLTTNSVGGMFGFFFSEEKNITSFKQVMACDQERFKTFYHSLLDQGIYLAPSAFETGFVSSAHSSEDLAATTTAMAKSFKELKQ
jgi:glutamate-1-semialdehyde 2,1-aminomutase